jgi:3-oxoacyl-[acyl-carrier protein] reductase
VAIITGGGHGIGKALSMGLSNEGAKIVIADIDESAAESAAHEIEQQGRESFYIHTNVANQKKTKEMARRTVDRFGRIDILINNAAYMIDLGLEKAWDQIDIEEWDRVMEVNLRGVFLCCRAVVPYMKTEGKGKIINISSSSAFWGFPGRIHYATSKAGILGFTKTLARELAGHGINVNAIAPGFTFHERVTSENYLTKERLKQLSRHTIECIKKDMHPKDLIGTAIFLASDDSEFICGETIIVDGGFFMH